MNKCIIASQINATDVNIYQASGIFCGTYVLKSGETFSVNGNTLVITEGRTHKFYKCTPSCIQFVYSTAF